MEASMTMTRATGRRAPAAMGKITAAALVALAGVLGYAQTVIGEFIPPIAGIALLALVFAGVVDTSVERRCQGRASLVAPTGGGPPHRAASPVG